MKVTASPSSDLPQEEIYEHVPRNWLPYHIRLRRYQEARERIMAISELHNTDPPKRSTLHVRAYWATGKRAHQFLSSVVLTDKPKGDLRPYASITFWHKDVLGLVDTGASMSCISAELAEQVLRKKISSHPKITLHIKGSRWDSSFHTRKGFCYGQVQGIYS